MCGVTPWINMLKGYWVTLYIHSEFSTWGICCLLMECTSTPQNGSSHMKNHEALCFLCDSGHGIIAYLIIMIVSPYLDNSSAKNKFLLFFFLLFLLGVWVGYLQLYQNRLGSQLPLHMMNWVGRRVKGYFKKVVMSQRRGRKNYLAMPSFLKNVKENLNDKFVRNGLVEGLILSGKLTPEWWCWHSIQNMGGQACLSICPPDYEPYKVHQTTNWKI